MNKRKQYGVQIIIIAVFLGLQGLSAFNGLQLRGLDVFQTPHTPHPDIVIVAIDDRSLQAVGRWPWDRQLDAQLVSKITAAHPRVLGFDINFSEPQDAKNDGALATSLGQAGVPVVLPVEAVYTSQSGSTPERFIQPIGLLSALPNVSLGNVNVPDSGGISRAWPASLSVADKAVVPFSVILAKAVSADISRTPAIISFAGPAGTFPMYSASDVINGQVDPLRLENKIVLVGATANDLHDFVSAPVTGQVLAGVEWHATVLDNILSQRGITLLPLWISLIISIIVGFLFLWLWRRGGMRLTWLVTLGLIIVLPGLSWLVWQSGHGLFYILTEFLIIALVAFQSLYRWYETEREKRKLRQTIKHYFSPQVMKVILDHPDALKLGGVRQEATVLFSDIRSFTTITETTPPELLTQLLHEYFTEMAEEVLMTDGVLDKFIGDAVMAFWGAPLPQPDQADRAVAAGLGMMRRLKRLQQTWEQRGWPFVDIGVGINTGIVTVGNMGSVKRFDYTVIGDTVNAASRLEGLNKEYKTHIIISENTLTRLTKPVQTRPLGDVIVKGKTKPLQIFEVIEDK